MIQMLLIVVPCVLIGTGAVFVVQRTGLLPRIEPTAPSMSRSQLHSNYRTFGPRSREWGLRPFAIAALVLMAGWIIFWMVLLIIGLNLIGGAS